MMATVTEEDLEKYKNLAVEVTENAETATVLVRKIRDKMSGWVDRGYDSASGLSFLELKNLTMLEYLSDLTYVMLKKTYGKSISGDQSIERIVENRTVLEKMRPVEKKLKYQIDKYIKLSETGKIRSDDPLHFKPNISALADDDSDSDGPDGEDDVESSGKKYVVPKHVPTMCQEDMTQEELEQEATVQERKKTLSKAILDDLKRQYKDAPEEDFNHSDTLKAKHIAQMRERIRYEEDNYIRLPDLSKKEKHKRKKSISTMGSLGDELTYFGSNNFFNEGASGKKRSRKPASKGSARKKFKRT